MKLMMTQRSITYIVLIVLLTATDIAAESLANEVTAAKVLWVGLADTDEHGKTRIQKVEFSKNKGGTTSPQKGLPSSNKQKNEAIAPEKVKPIEDTWLAKKLARSIVFLIIVVITLIFLRIIATRQVKDAQRRYYINRSLSIFTVFVFIIGLLVIFVRDLSHMITGMGVAVAGLAIALQETVTAFCGWFVIQGSKGYRIGDWIRVGEHSGEVVDISLLVTILAEVTPLKSSGDTGGSWTGGLVGFSNAAVFKVPFINYTKGYPYVWCQLDYTFTYESNWKTAERLILEATREEEILDTAKKARINIKEIAAKLAIKMDKTDPKVRMRVGASGVELSMRFLAHPRRRLDLMDKINRQIMEAVGKENQIEFAYNTNRIITTPHQGAVL